MDVEFEPVRLGARRHRIDPVAAGAVVVIVAVAVSIVKPWDDRSTPNDAVVVPEPTAAMTVRPGKTPPIAAIPRVIAATTRSAADWPAIRPVLGRHDAWGVRAIVAKGGTYSERWFLFPSGGTKMSTAYLDGGNESIVALGVTFPPSHTPLDVRIWQETAQGFAWVDAEALDPSPTGGAFLYGRVARPGPSRPAWAAGRYRMDVLVDGSVRRFGVSIPDRFSNVPVASNRPNLHDMRPPVVTDIPNNALIDVPFGLFATADGLAVPLPADAGTALDEVGAWLDVDPGTRRAPRSFVAEAWLPGATRLGVMLEGRVLVMSANIARLAPEPMPSLLPAIDHTPRDGVASSSVVFRAPGAGGWTPGVYRITVVWADVDGVHEGSWHADLHPGPVPRPSHLLAAARAWARYAGDTGIVRGTAEPLEGGPRSATIRLERPAPEDGAGYPVRDRLPCDGFRVEGPAGTFGVAQPVGAPLADVRARAHFEYSRSGEQPILTSAGNLPGLILVATDAASAPTSLAHRYRVGEDVDPSWSSLCVEVR